MKDIKLMFVHNVHRLGGLAVLVSNAEVAIFGDLNPLGGRSPPPTPTSNVHNKSVTTTAGTHGMGE
jgi:hypothetical protein